MLYDILPPVIFFMSLGGVILIVARVSLRARRAAFSAAVESAVTEPSPEEVLQPSQKSVQAMGSRVALGQKYFMALGRGLGSMPRRTGSAIARVGSKIRLRRARAAELTESTEPLGDEEETASSVSLPSPSAAKPIIRSGIRLERRETTAASVAETLRRSVKRHAPRPKADSPITAAEQALEAHEYLKAENILVPYIVHHAKDTQAYILLGQAAIGREAWEEAMEIFEQVIQWDADSKGAYASLGYAAYRAGRLTRALQALQRAHEAEPNNDRVLQQLLSIAQRLDNRALQHSISEKLEALTQGEASATERIDARE
jgi:tetratricopeptide (TPR) repeat protein